MHQIDLKKWKLAAALSFFAFFNTMLIAQNPINLNEFTDSVIVENKISEIKCDETKISKKGKHYVSRSIMRFDEYGRNDLELWMHDTLKNVKIVLNKNNGYDQAKNKYNQSYLNQSYGKHGFFMLVNFNDSSKVSSYQYFNPKGKLYYTHKWQWTDSTLLTVKNYNGKNKLRDVYKHYYLDRKTLKRTERYNSKGKLKFIVDYNCDAKGTVVAVKSDTMKACVEKSFLADGSVVTITNSFNSNGNPYRIVSIEDSLKRNTYYAYFSGKKQELVHSTKYLYNGNKLLQVYKFQAFGNAKYWRSTYTEFNEKGQVTSRLDSTSYSKKMEVEKFTFTYNDKGLVETRIGHINNRQTSYAYFRYRFYK